MEKRGQLTGVTIFIIIGILLLITAGIITYLRLRLEKIAPEEEIAAEEIAEWAAPIKLYVEECIQEKGVEGLKKIGEHGGYIDMSDSYLSNKTFYLDQYKPYDSDAVSLSTSALMPVAYWWHLNREGTLTSEAPLLEEIESQLDSYIIREIDSCLKDFSPFRKQGFGFEKGDINPNTKIATENVVFNVNYPLTLTKGDAKATITRFRAEADIDFDDIYDLAGSIALIQIGLENLDYVLLHLISSYGVAPPQTSMIPPIAWVDNEATTVTWSKNMVEQKFKDEILPLTSLIQIAGTKDAVNLGDDYRIFNFDVLPVSFPELSTNFIYLGWPIQFDLTPSDGDILRPSIVKTSYPFDLAPPFQTNTYEFFYDITYPVVVRIVDDNALIKSGEKGYSFMFALEVNLRDNKRMSEWFTGNGTIGPWNARENIQLEIRAGADPVYTNYNPVTGINTTYDLSNIGSTSARSLFCDYNAKASNNITFVVKNGTNPLDGASVSYGCGDYSTCYLGVTNAGGKLVERLPVCTGGYLLFEREGFMSKAIQFSVPTAVNSVDEKLEPFRYKNVKLKKYEMATMNMLPSSSASINQQEQVMMSIEKVLDADNPLDQELSQFVMFNPNMDLSAIQKIKLVPGKYKISASLIDNEGFTIPARCKHICEEGTDPTEDCDAADEWVPDARQDIIPSIAGGLDMNENTGYWVVGSSLDYGNDVEFYIIEAPTPTCLDYDCELPVCIGLEEMSKTANYTKMFRWNLEPIFS